MRIVPLVLACVASSACPSVDNYYRTLDLAERRIDVAYIDDGLGAHTLDYYAPRQTHRRDPAFPVVVFVHGGYWRSQDKAYFQTYAGTYGNVCTSLVELGIGCVNINYRLHPSATFQEMLDDVVAAIAWSRDHVSDLNGDPGALFLAGHSAGGHLVAFLATHPEELRARGVEPELVRGVVSLSGIYDIPATVTRVEPELSRAVFVPLFGDTAEKQLLASPMRGFDQRMLTTYFIVGEQDYPGCMHDHLEAEQLLAGRTGDRAFFAIVPGNTHEDMVREIGTDADEVTPKIAAFVRFLR